MRRPIVALLVVIAGAALALPAAGQDAGFSEDEEAIRSVVQHLFDGMRAGDSAAVRSTLDDSARLVSTGTRDGEPVMHSGSIDSFVEAVGQPHDEVWDERLWDIEIRIDDALATVWTQYAFYVGPKLSHCGVDAFQLFKSADGWKILQIADTRRTEGCEIPEDE